MDTPVRLTPPALVLALACGAMFALTSGARVTAERIPGPSGPLDVMFCQPPGEPDGLVIAAHGTNSHKEVFLPLAWELAARRWALASVDSRTLSTQDGVVERARELIATRDAFAGWMRRARLGFVGHSDGVTPALAAARLAPGARPPVVVLGSTFTREEREGLELRAYAGALDQVFPVPDIRGCAERPPPVPLQVSWLSDHFLEQYDPVLVPAMASALTGPGRVPYAAERCAGRVLALCVALLSALALGARTARAGAPAARALVVAALFLWIAGSAIVWPAALAVALIAGVLAGSRALAGAGPVIVITGLLMLANVFAFSPVVRADISAALPWVPLLGLWYVVAWIPKAFFFAVWVITNTGPAGMWAPPGLLALALFALATPGLGDRVLARAPDGSRPRGSATLAAGLLALMFVLWAVRLSQGFVHPDVLAAIGTNFTRSLLLPGAYLALLATGRLRRG